jgi:siderophore synthetase component
MLLSTSLTPKDVYMYLERYVNDGSPSGFTDRFSTSTETSPLSENPSFNLYSVYIPEHLECLDIGIQPDFLSPRQVLVHPDMIHSSFLAECCDKRLDSGFLVFPTASARTVGLVDKPEWFIKLSYDGMIGRIDRQIGLPQASAAIEVSNKISEAIDNGYLPGKFYFMREPFARVANLKAGLDSYEWGMVIREPYPYPRNGRIKYLFPAFSLFSMDRGIYRGDSHPTLLEQIIEASGKKPENVLLNDIIFPVLDSYFSLLLKCGLQLESHAQNTLFGVDENFQIIAVIAKDAESIDRDKSLMVDLGIEVMETECNYKCLHRDQYNYQIMHSFMYDFKLGQYLFDPLIRLVSIVYRVNESSLLSEIKSFAHSYISRLPSDFFPGDGMWYSYEAIVHDRNKPRPYVARPEPRYR